MTATTARGMPPHITVRGTVHLGREMELVEALPERAPAAHRPRLGMPDDGGLPAWEFTAVTTPGHLRVQRLVHRLAPLPAEVTIDDDGLVASYGIFGAPGAGKTHLLLHVLQQVLALGRDDPERKYGALILDPKGALVPSVRAAVDAAGRADDLVVLDPEEMARSGHSVNLIDSDLPPLELGRSLVLAAQSAGVAASDPFWFIAWSNLFGAALRLLRLLEPDVPTIRRLLQVTLVAEPRLDGDPERPIQRMAREARQRAGDMPPGERDDLLQSVSEVESFFASDYVATIGAFISRGYGSLQQSRFRCFSPVDSAHRRRTPFYEQIIDEGKIVLVSLSPSEADVAKTVCTLVKCLFQHAVFGRFKREPRGGNVTRPVVFACDEYAEIASEVPGLPMGDGHFFSLARQFGCMGLMATQSVNVLQASSLKENWRSVFSTLGAKVFLRLVDNETIEEATKLAGEHSVYVTSEGLSRSKDGLSVSANTDLRERKALPSQVLTHVFTRGEAVIIGSLDGNRTEPRSRFVKVPQVP